MLLQHGVLSEDSIAFLWQLTQGGSRGSSSSSSREGPPHDVLRARLYEVRYVASASFRCVAAARPVAFPPLPALLAHADETTFEVVKSNAYSMLASLGPHMEPAQLAHLFTRLQHRAAASGVAEATSICSLLVGMAAQDVQVGGWVGG